MHRLKATHLYWLIAIGSIGSVLFAAYYLQARLDLLPCPLCVMQRMAFLVVGFVALVAALQRPDGGGRHVYGSLMLLTALTGAGIAAWHTFLTYQPQLASCGISPEERFLNKLALARWWPTMFEANGDCTKVDWRFLGLSIPELSIIAFVLLGALVLLAWRRPR